jgi:hypothetical protein
MQTIVFQTTDAGQCLTDCKIIPGIKIGSHTCTHCVNCLAFDSVEKTIKCNVNKENYDKTGSIRSDATRA